MGLSSTDALAGFGPTRAERLALRVVQIGALATVLAATSFGAFELDRFFVPKELALHATACIAGLLTLGAASRLRATRVDLFLVAFLVLGALSSIFATNPWLATRALAISASGVVLFWVGRALRDAGLARPLGVALALAVVVTVVTALAQAYGLEAELFATSRVPGGTLGNRNFVAHVAAFGFPLVVLGALRAWRAPAFLLGAVGVLLTTGTLILTRSRAAWLGWLAVTGVLLLGFMLAGPLRRDRALFRRFALLLLFAGGGAAAAVTLPNALRWRSDAPYAETARGVVNYREGSGRGRLIQYRTSGAMALKDPLLGVGPGNWAAAYPEHAAPGDPSLDPNEAGRTANPWPSSDWIAFLAERGIPALLALALALIGLAVAGARRLWTARDSEEGLLALALLATLAGILVVGLFDAALLLAWPTLIVWTAVGALWAPEAARPLRTTAGLRRGVPLALALAAGVGALRSSGQLAAMAIHSSDPDRADLELAARLDPGNYRVRLWLARSYGRRDERRCLHALAARDLYPHAATARQLARRCE